MISISDILPNISVIEPDDKIILATNVDDKRKGAILCNQVESFLTSKHRVLVVNHFDVYIIKRGAIVLLRDKAGQMSQEMRVNLYGDRFNCG